MRVYDPYGQIYNNSLDDAMRLAGKLEEKVSKETSEEISSIAGRVLNLPETPSTTSSTPYKDLLADAKRLAASCLSQREPDSSEKITIGEYSIEIPPELEGNYIMFRAPLPNFPGRSCSVIYGRDDFIKRLELINPNKPEEIIS